MTARDQGGTQGEVCAGHDEANDQESTGDEQIVLACMGTASEWHLNPAHPHLFCGCGNEAAYCHPTRCCEDDEGGCKNCGREADPVPTPEIELSDPLFEVIP